MIVKKQKIAIGCDHAGFELKEKIKVLLFQLNYDIQDYGTYSTESCDYPDIIHPLAKAINNEEFNLGIIICGSGNGVNITANKYLNVRSALCWNEEIAELARKHNNANILAMPARFITEQTAKEIVETFLNTAFEGNRHQQRIEKIKKILE